MAPACMKIATPPPPVFHLHDYFYKYEGGFCRASPQTFILLSLSMKHNWWSHCWWCVFFYRKHASKLDELQKESEYKRHRNLPPRKRLQMKKQQQADEEAKRIMWVAFILLWSMVSLLPRPYIVFVTCHAEHSGVWKGILIAVFLLCPLTDISVMVTPISKIVKFGLPKSDYLKNDKSQHYISIRA